MGTISRYQLSLLDFENSVYIYGMSTTLMEKGNRKNKGGGKYCCVSQ